MDQGGCKALNDAKKYLYHFSTHVNVFPNSPAARICSRGLQPKFAWLGATTFLATIPTVFLSCMLTVAWMSLLQRVINNRGISFPAGYLLLFFLRGR